MALFLSNDHILFSCRCTIVSEMKGYGRWEGNKEIYRGGYQVGFMSKIKIEVIVGKNPMDEVVEKIVKSARTG